MYMCFERKNERTNDHACFEQQQGYGTSEIQFGHALKKHERSSFILQSKAAPKADPQAFREGLELSFQKLQVSYPILPCSTFRRGRARTSC